MFLDLDDRDRETGCLHYWIEAEAEAEAEAESESESEPLSVDKENTGTGTSSFFETSSLGTRKRNTEYLAYLRVMDEGKNNDNDNDNANAKVRRIGRVVTAAQHRGRGYSRLLMQHAIEDQRVRQRQRQHQCQDAQKGVVEGGAGGDVSSPFVLDAQSYLVDSFYRPLGFTVCGPEFLEDGIPHKPMRMD